MKPLALLLLILSFSIHAQEPIDLEDTVVSIFIGEVIKGEIIERPENTNNLSVEELLSSGKGFPMPWGKYEVKVVENIAGDKYTSNVILFAPLWIHNVSHEDFIPRISLNPAPGIKYVFKTYYTTEGLKIFPYKQENPEYIDRGRKYSVSNIKLGLPISFYYYDDNGSTLDSSVTPINESGLPWDYFSGYKYQEYKSYIVSEFNKSMLKDYQHYLSIKNSDK